MADNTSKTNGPEAERIDVAAGEGLQGWAKKFDVTPAQIREAVQAVGDQAADVEMHLKGSHATTNADREAKADKLEKGK